MRSSRRAPVGQHEIVAVPAEPSRGPGPWQGTALEIDGSAEIAMQRLSRRRPRASCAPRLSRVYR